MSDQPRPGHLPECKFRSWNELAEKHGYEPPEDRDWGAQAGVMECPEGCPSRERAVELGRELMRRGVW